MANVAEQYTVGTEVFYSLEAAQSRAGELASERLARVKGTVSSEDLTRCTVPVLRVDGTVAATVRPTP